jgi:uncharacterized protein (DUF2342 family)
VARLLGLDLKLKQYEQGKRFCDAVVDQAGPGALRYVFSSPDAVPTMGEIEAPERWLERTAGQRAEYDGKPSRRPGKAV